MAVIDITDTSTYTTSTSGASTSAAADVNRDAINDALSSMSDGDELRIPGSGVYDVAKSDPNATEQLLLDGVANFRIVAPDGAWIRRYGESYTGAGDEYLFHMKNCTRGVIEALRLDGNKQDVTGTPDEQTHCLQVGEGSEHLEFRDYKNRNSLGDGVRFLGSAQNPVRFVTFIDPEIWDFKRSGLGYQHDVSHVLIQNALITASSESDQCVDGESSSGTGPAFCHFVGGKYDALPGSSYAIAWSATVTTGPCTDSLFKNLTILGEFDCVNNKDLTLEGVSLYGQRATVPAFSCRRVGDNVRLIRCEIWAPVTTGPAVKFGILNSERPSDAEVRECIIRTTKTGILMDRVTGARVEGNQIFGAGSGAGYKVDVPSGTDDSLNMRCIDNTFHDFTNARHYNAGSADITREDRGNTSIRCTTEKKDDATSPHTITDL